jgi:polysaccharide pyruvyl transferase WcaK-like protein
MSTLFALEDKIPSCDRYVPSAGPVAPELRILLLTPYTGGNLGDGAIQDALIHHFRKRVSEPRIRLVTLCPGSTSKLHRLPAFPIASSEYDSSSPEPCILANLESHDAGASHSEPIKKSLGYVPWLYRIIVSVRRSIRRVGSLLRGARGELRHVFRVYQLLKETDLLVISGGGQIDDYWGGAFGHPYALFKWASLSRISNTSVVFLSVGVGSLGSPLSRFFAHRALHLASYRSYRDRGSKELLRDAIFTRVDPEYPDLAFSHPCARQQTFVSRDSSRKHSVIGVSPIAYLSPHGWPERDPSVYERYLQTLGEFIEKVLEAGHTVVLFTSALMDQIAVKDLQARLRQIRGSESWGSRLQQVDQTCVDKQLEEIRKLDMVVASRLHGIILSHLLGKPTLAISYDRKVRAHMEAMAQERFCLDFRDCTLSQLWDGFTGLGLESSTISTGLRSKAKEYSQKLDLQYDLLVQLVGHASRARRHDTLVKTS